MQRNRVRSLQTVGFLHGAGAETLFFTSGKIVPRQKKTKVSGAYPENQEKLVLRHLVLRSKPQRKIPQLRLGCPPLREFQNRSGRSASWEKKRPLLTIVSSHCKPEMSALFQRKTKGQQLKGKIVSEFFTLFHKFSHIFRIFPPGLSPSEQRALAQGEEKRRKEKKREEK